MQFFTSPDDLKGWVKSQDSADLAANKIMEIIGRGEEQDVVDTCRIIYDKENSDNASEILFGVLAKHDITQRREGKMQDKIKKEAQMMRQDAVYGQMDMRICPKLPFSQGKRLISTYNCRHYCLDSLVFDDDPARVYCAEALWRRHVMDKFSREFKDKDGKWVGGYINQRFQVFHDDGGNQMQLAHGERTRKPRPHQYSTERRLSEGRGEKTFDLTALSSKMVKLAAVEVTTGDAYKMFSDIIEMKSEGLNDEDIIIKVAEHYGETIIKVAAIYKLALKQVQAHDGIVYATDNIKKNDIKIAQIDLPEKATMITKKDVEVKIIQDGKESIVKMETPVVVVSNGNNPVFHIVDGPDSGKEFTLKNVQDISTAFGMIDETQEKIQDAAEEMGLNELLETPANEDFPVVEI